MATNPFGYSGFGQASGAFGGQARQSQLAAYQQAQQLKAISDLANKTGGQLGSGGTSRSVSGGYGTRLSPDGDPAYAPQSFQQKLQSVQNPAQAPSNGIGASPSGGGGPAPSGGGGQPPIQPMSAAAPPAPAADPNRSATTGGDFNLGSGGATTAFGKSFTPESYGQAWSDPASVINQYLKQAGVASNTGQGAMTQQLGDNLGILYMLLQGDEAAKGTGNYLDWTGQFLDNQRTPGGRAVSPQEVMQAILTDDDKSLMYHNLYGNEMLPGQQVDAVLGSMRYGLEGALPAPILDAVLSRAASLGQDFTTGNMTGGKDLGTFGKYLTAQGLTADGFR